VNRDGPPDIPPDDQLAADALIVGELFARHTPDWSRTISSTRDDLIVRAASSRRPIEYRPEDQLDASRAAATAT
jgi:hypothetical protein